MVALFAVWARRGAYFIAAGLLALPLAHADPAGDAAALATGPLSKELEGHLWLIDYLTFERSIRRDQYIFPAGDDGSEAYITFENGEISGSLGCGELTGRYTLFDDRVQISNVGRTDRRRCGIRFLVS